MGTVAIASFDGEGARFVVTLPRGRLILCAPSGVLERSATHQTSIRTVANAD
jgi:hypothetical protein